MIVLAAPLGLPVILGELLLSLTINLPWLALTWLRLTLARNGLIK